MNPDLENWIVSEIKAERKANGEWRTSMDRRVDDMIRKQGEFMAEVRKHVRPSPDPAPVHVHGNPPPPAPPPGYPPARTSLPSIPDGTGPHGIVTHEDLLRRDLEDAEKKVELSNARAEWIFRGIAGGILLLMIGVIGYLLKERDTRERKYDRKESVRD